MKTYFSSKRTFLELLQEAEQLSDVTLHEGYSGRGMFGKKCFAVYGSPKGLSEFLKNSILLFKEEMIFSLDPMVEDCDPESDFDELIDFLLSYSQDSLGLDTIIYWDKVQDLAL